MYIIGFIDIIIPLYVMLIELIKLLIKLFIKTKF